MGSTQEDFAKPTTSAEETHFILPQHGGGGFYVSLKTEVSKRIPVGLKQSL